MRLSKVLVLLAFLLGLMVPAFAGGPASESTGITPPTVSKFRRTGLINFPDDPDAGGALASSASEYAGPNASKVSVERFRFRQEAQAYEVLSLVSAAAAIANSNIEIVNGIGTAGFATDNEVSFLQGCSRSSG